MHAIPSSLLRYGHTYGIAPASFLSLPTLAPAPDPSLESVAETEIETETETEAERETEAEAEAERERRLLVDKKKAAMQLPVLGVRVQLRHSHFS